MPYRPTTLFPGLYTLVPYVTVLAERFPGTVLLRVAGGKALSAQPVEPVLHFCRPMVVQPLPHKAISPFLPLSSSSLCDEEGHQTLHSPIHAEVVKEIIPAKDSLQGKYRNAPGDAGLYREQYRLDGQHLSQAEADVWLEQLANGDDVDLPPCHG